MKTDIKLKTQDKILSFVDLPNFDSKEISEWCQNQIIVDDKQGILNAIKDNSFPRLYKSSIELGMDNTQAMYVCEYVFSKLMLEHNKIVEQQEQEGGLK